MSGDARIEDLSPEEKRALLVRLLKASGDGRRPAVSDVQQRFWVLRQMEPGIPTHVTKVFDVRGPLDAGAFAAGFAAAVRAHEALRTAFVEIDARPVRLVLPEGEVAEPAVSVVDLTGLDDESQDGEIRRIVEADALRPFDAGRAPLLRGTLARRGAQRWAAVLAAHQLVADEASLHLMAADVARACAAAGTGQRPAYGVFAARQQEWLATPAAAEHIDGWTRRLAGAPPVVLPTDHPRPSVKAASLCGSWCEHALPREVAPAVDALAADLAVSRTAVLLAAAVMLLSRYSGQRDVTVGVPVAGRWEPEWQQVVGPLERPLPVRVDLRADPSFRAAVRLVEDRWQEAWRRRDVPFERLLTELGHTGEVDVARPPLFAVRVAIDEPAPPISAGELRWTPVRVHNGLSPFDLTFRIGREHVGVEFATDLFVPETASRMLRHLVNLLRRATAEPATRLLAIDFLGREERRTLLRHSRGAEAPPDAVPSLHGLVEDQARRTPFAVAVSAGSAQLTYRELDERAGGLARRLRGLGVGPEVRVGVAAERAVDTVVALLGVLKAGGAYVPLDADMPPERLAFVLADAKVAVVVAPERLREAFAVGSVVVVPPVAGEVPAGGAAGEVPAFPAGSGCADRLAYVLYTSGSTGRPKGVLVSHRQIVNSTLARSAAGRVAPGDYPGGTYVVAVPLTFDASAAGLYWTLATGGRVVLPGDGEVADPVRLGRLIEAEHATHFTHMPSYYHALLVQSRGRLRRLRDVSVGGETCSATLVDDHYRMLPWTRLYNDYGPTEGTVWATVYLCRPGTAAAASVPIGRPVAGVQVYVTDRDLELVPAGVEGEIHIGGEQVARGYLGQPGLTAERFVPDPFGSRPGGRLYRTGDLGRWSADGQLEFAGRVDGQVKIRGYRVEPGEVEAVLQEHPGVGAAVVTAPPDGGGQRRLVAYLAGRGGQVPGREALLSFLARRLPEYMLPSVFVPLERFPRTPHGKIDRASLSEPGAGDGVSGDPTRGLSERQVDALLREWTTGRDLVAVARDEEDPT